MSVEIDKLSPILVTGGTGYLAMWLIKQLLDEGLNVRTTVRSTANNERNAQLRKLGENTDGSLKLYEADLLKEGSFEQAMSDWHCPVLVDSFLMLPQQRDFQNAFRIRLG